jgi:hypothetical protein
MPNSLATLRPLIPEISINMYVALITKAEPIEPVTTSMFWQVVLMVGG